MEFSGNLSHLMEINSTSVSELARFVGVSRQAVLGWKNGSIPTKDKIMKIAEYYNKSIGYFGFEEDEDIHDGEIPVVGSIQAGYPVESFGDASEYIRPSFGWITNDMFALRVIGDSMLPLVMDGDIIILDKNTERANGKICAVTVDNESTLKKVKKDSKGITLIPINPMFRELHYDPKQCEEMNIHIDGVLVEMVRRF